MSERSDEDGRETITPLGELHRVIADLGPVLDSPTLDPEVAGVAASQLESATYDLALAVIRWEDASGDAQEAKRVRAGLREIEERLLWVQQNRFDADRRRTREVLLAARNRARDIFTRLVEEGIVLEAIETESGRNPHIREQ